MIRNIDGIRRTVSRATSLEPRRQSTKTRNIFRDTNDRQGLEFIIGSGVDQGFRPNSCDF